MLESEKGVISCLLIDPNLALTTRLLPEHFTNDLFKSCFEYISSNPGKDIPINILADKVGISSDEAFDISRFCITAGGYSQYEDDVIQSYIYRKYSELSDKIHKESQSKGAIDKIKTLVSDIGKVGVEGLEKKTLVAGSIETMLKLAEGREQSTICDFGFNSLDTYLRGYRAGSLITVGARTGVGKSTFGLNLISKALDNGQRCCLFSTEMPASEIHARFMAQKASVTQYSIENMASNEQVTERIVDVMGTLEQSVDCVIYDRFGDFQNLCNLIRLEVLEGTRLFFIDYLQNITNRSQFSLKTHIIGEMSTGLKKLAIELGVCVVLMAQLNRESSKDANKRPRKEQLRESGDIEQDSDVIILLHDESKYDELAPKNRLEVIIDKNRHGSELSFTMGTTRKYFTIYDL